MRRLNPLRAFHCVPMAAIMVLGLCGARAYGAPTIQAITQGGLAGGKFVKLSKGQRDKPYKWTIFFGYPMESPDDILAGGMATFGVFDSGQIMLINHTEYVPNLSSVSYGRDLYPANRIFDKSDLPRYLMTCAWPQEEGQSPSSTIYAYAERDDSNFTVEDHGAYVTQSARWPPVPPKRAQDKFAAHDYCGELATNRKSSVPMWLPQTKYE